MSTLATTNLKHPSSGSNNIVLAADGTTTITAPSNIIKSGTAVASTSGTAIDFTGIPSWVKRITVMIQGLSTNGTSSPIIQLGTSGGIQATSYTGSAWFANTTNVLNSTGFLVHPNIGAATITEALVTICLANSSTGLWVSSVVGAQTNSAGGVIGSGSKTLSGTLDRIRITTANGTDTFDAGSINILWEG
jgi:hypothetical protein